MEKLLGLFFAGGAALLLSACSPDTSSDYLSSDDYSSSSSSSSYSGSCYDAGGGICGYYYNMNESEYSNMRGQCYNWYDGDNVCDGNTQYNHRSPEDQSYTQICFMDTSNSDSHLDVYNYGLTYDEAQWSEEQCYSHGGSSSIVSY